MSDDEQARRGRRTLILLVAVFVVPLALAVGWYALAPQLAPPPAAHGELIDPARPLEPFSLPAADGGTFTRADLRGRWTLVQFVGPRCGDGCREQLYYTRQVRDALGEDRLRVRRVAVATRGGATPGLTDVLPTHPRLRVLEGARDGELGRQFPPPRDDATVFVVDPLGNLMMRFDPGVPADAMLDDLEQLLEVSRIG